MDREVVAGAATIPPLPTDGREGASALNISPALPAETDYADDLRGVGVENWIALRPASHLREAAEAALADPSIFVTASTGPIRALEMRIFWVRLRRLVDRAVRDWRPDVVILVHGMAAAWSGGLPEHLPAILGLHDLQWHWYLSRAERQAGARSLLLRIEAERYRRHVLRMLPRFRAAVTVSTKEADELRRNTGIPVSVIPVGVDTSALRPAPEQPGRPRLIFTGTLSYPPNSQAIRWFADQVWPIVVREVPNAQLDVVGRDPPRPVLALNERQGITVVGSVPAMASYFHRSHAVIVPVLTGAGVRVKIVEAMAAGRAIVSTSLGCEGLPYVLPDKHLLVANGPGEFAACTVRLLREPALRSRLAAEARRLAESRYDWRALGDEQEAVLRSVLAQASQQRAGLEVRR